MKLMLTFVLGFKYEEVQADEDVKTIDTSKVETTSSETGLQLDLIKPSPTLRKSCTIEYELPKQGIKTVHLVYFGTYAQVTLDKASVFTKCIILGYKSFVCFTVFHHVESKNRRYPEILMNHDFTFDFRMTKESVKKKVKENRQFYYVQDQVEDDFGYLIESNGNKSPVKIDQLFVKAGSRDYLLKRVCKFHWKNSKALINDADVKVDEILRSEITEEKRSLISGEDVEKENSLGKHKRKTPAKRKSKKRSIADISMVFPGSKLLYEKSAWTIKEVSSSSELLFGGVIMTATKVLTEDQRSNTKTLSISVKSIQCLPPSLSEFHRIESLSVEYSLPPICQSEIIPPERLDNQSKLKFDHFKTFLNDSVPDQELIETVQSGNLIVKVYGHRLKAALEEEPLKVWGQDLFCDNFAKRYCKIIDKNDISKADQYKAVQSIVKKTNKLKGKPQNQKKKSKKISSKVEDKTVGIDSNDEETVFVGFARLELNDLMRYSHRIVSLAPLYSTMSDPTDNFTMELRPMNPNHFHCDFRNSQKAIVNQQEFNLHKTSIKIEFKIGYNLNRFVLNEVLTLPNLFTRCFIIDYDIRSGYKLLQELLTANNLTRRQGRPLPNYGLQNLGLIPEILTRKIDADEENDGTVESNLLFDTTEATSQEVFTGFMVDAISFSVLMIESLEISTISKVMLLRYQTMQEDGRVLYDSNMIYTERLYDQFMKFGGIFVTALGLPLEAVLNHKRVSQWVPEPAYRCLETIKAISNAREIRPHLFPSPLELLSMDLEFGVPLNKVETVLQ